MGGTFTLRAACEIDGLAAAAPFYGDIPDESVLKDLKVNSCRLMAPARKFGNRPVRFVRTQTESSMKHP